MKVVGKVVYSSEETQDDADVQRDGGALFTPALTRLLARCCANFTETSVQLDPGTSVAAAEASIQQVLPKGFPIEFYVTVAHRGQGGAGHRADLDRARGLRRDRGGGRAAHRRPGHRQAAAPRRRRPRHAARARREPGRDDRRRAARRARRHRRPARCWPAAVAVGLSPLAPLGSIRAVYPYPGVAFDWTVLGAGFALFICLLAAAARW